VNHHPNKRFIWIVVAIAFATCVVFLTRRLKHSSISSGSPQALATPEPQPASPQPARSPRPVPDAIVVPAEPINLTAFYNTRASIFARMTNSGWSVAPRGFQTLGNVPLQIGGIIDLWGAANAQGGRAFREKVLGIPVRRKFESLYVYHAAFFSSPDGTPISEVVCRYTDDSSVTNVICYGTHVKDWFQNPNDTSPGAIDPNSKIVWTGTFTGGMTPRILRFFVTAFPNPTPTMEVATIDLYSRKDRVASCIMAITAGPSGLLKPVR
jgi:hypothetical protein